MFRVSQALQITVIALRAIFSEGAGQRTKLFVRRPLMDDRIASLAAFETLTTRRSAVGRLRNFSMGGLALVRSPADFRDRHDRHSQVRGVDMMRPLRFVSEREGSNDPHGGSGPR